MTQQSEIQIQKPTEFKYVTRHLGKTAYLSDLVRIAGSNNVFQSKYFDVGLALQNLIADDQFIFMPLDSHIYEMIKAGVNAQYEATGSVLLIPGDKGLVNPIVEPRIKIKNPTWTHYGVSHTLGSTPNDPKIKIFDEAKLVETNIPLNVHKIVHPKKIESGTLMEIQDKPNPDYPNEIVWLDSRYEKDFDKQPYDHGINPLRRDSGLGLRGWVSGWGLDGGPSDSVWRSRLGSVENRTADRKHIIQEKIQEFRNRLDTIPAQRPDQLPTYARNLKAELDQLTKELSSS